MSDFASAKKLLLDINEVVKQMDPAVRVATFEVLTKHFLDAPAPVRAKPASTKGDAASKKPEHAAPNTDDLGSFLSQFDTSKPHESLNLLVAWIFSQRGSHPFTIIELKELAHETGLTIPTRPDMTFKGAKNGGKNLFMQSGKKNWKLTVAGEVHFKETYKVTKGNKPPPASEE